MTYVIARFQNNPPHLVEVMEQAPLLLQGRDVTRGGRIGVRPCDVIAQYTDEGTALTAFAAVKAAITVEDARVARAWAAYTKAQRTRTREIVRAAQAHRVPA